MSSSKQLWTGTAVPNARGLTDFIAGSSIETRIVLAAAIGTCDVTNARGKTTMSLRKQNKTKQNKTKQNRTDNDNDVAFIWRIYIRSYALFTTLCGRHFRLHLAVYRPPQPPELHALATLCEKCMGSLVSPANHDREDAGDVAYRYSSSCRNVTGTEKRELTL